jgi:hypothetical protein
VQKLLSIYLAASANPSLSFGYCTFFTRNAANMKSIFRSLFDDDYAARGIRDRVLEPPFPDSIVTTDGHERKKERNEYFPKSNISVKE